MRPQADELIQFVKDRTARFKAPRAIVFGELPKTSTGKVEKHRLRERLQSSQPTFREGSSDDNERCRGYGSWEGRANGESAGGDA